MKLTAENSIMSRFFVMTQTPGYPNGSTWPEQPPSYFEPQAARTSGCAVASLICGILGLVTCCTFVPSILGVVLGGVALPAIRCGQARGRGLAVSGIILGILGALAGLVVWIVLALAPEAVPISGREVSESDRSVLESMGVLEADEQIELFYASGMFSIREGGSLITADRLVVYYSESDIQSCRLADIAAIDFTPAANMFEDGHFLVARDNRELLIFIVGGQGGGDKMFHSVLRQRAAGAREAASKPPVASGLLPDDDGD